MERIRITFEKTGAMRYTSHLDMQKVWIRALLRAKLPLAYTQGFHPTPKVAYAWPLPLGWGTEGELMDIWLDDPEGKEAEADSFIRDGPDLLEDLSRSSAPDPSPGVWNDAVSAELIAAVHQIIFPDLHNSEDLKEKMTELMSQETIERERRGKTYDMKPLIEDWLCGMDDKGEVFMNVQMAARDSAMGRPDELAAALGFDPFAVNITRLKYIL